VQTAATSATTTAKHFFLFLCAMVTGVLFTDAACSILGSRTSDLNELVDTGIQSSSSSSSSSTPSPRLI
jgi:hypothetical protein